MRFPKEKGILDGSQAKLLSRLVFKNVRGIVEKVNRLAVFAARLVNGCQVMHTRSQTRMRPVPELCQDVLGHEKRFFSLIVFFKIVLDEAGKQVAFRLPTRVVRPRLKNRLASPKAPSPPAAADCVSRLPR